MKNEKLYGLYIVSKPYWNDVERFSNVIFSIRKFYQKLHFKQNYRRMYERIHFIIHNFTIFPLSLCSCVYLCVKLSKQDSDIRNTTSIIKMTYTIILKFISHLNSCRHTYFFEIESFLLSTLALTLSRKLSRKSKIMCDSLSLVIR